jgi:hypothetical protein
MLDRQCEMAMDQIRSRYATTASQMLCPVHQKNAKVEVETDDFDNLSLEVFACCDQFRERVRRALKDIPPSPSG